MPDVSVHADPDRGCDRPAVQACGCGLSYDQAPLGSVAIELFALPQGVEPVKAVVDGIGEGAVAQSLAPPGVHLVKPQEHERTSRRDKALRRSSLPWARSHTWL